MADAYTGTTAQSNLVQAAVDRYVRAQLRHMPLLRNVADTRPVQVDKPGSSVTFHFHGDLAPATTPLNELTDPDAVALPNTTTVQVTLNEYGNATVTSARLRSFSFSDVDPNQQDQIAYNMRDTLDDLVRDILSGGTNVRYSGDATSTATVDNTDTISSSDLRYAVTKLRGNAAPGRRGELYWCGIHPDVSHDLKEETGATGWFEAHKYAAPGNFWPNEIGTYAGCFFQESSRMKNETDGADIDPGTGTTNATVYRTIVAGKEALAEAVAIEPHVEVGVVPDKLNRFFPLGWYGLLGWGRFREKCLYRIESGSSVDPQA